MNDIENEINKRDHLINYKCPGIKEESSENEEFSSDEDIHKKKSLFAKKLPFKNHDVYGDGYEYEEDDSSVDLEKQTSKKKSHKN